jgi:hypothetical protein
LLAKAERVLSLPDTPAALTTLSAFSSEIGRSNLSSSERSAIGQRARNKALSIARPEMERILNPASAVPVSLEGLAEATAALRRARSIAAPMPVALGADELSRMMGPLVTHRARILGDSAVQASFAETMKSIRPQGNLQEAVQALASRYLDRAEWEGQSVPRLYAASVSAAGELAAIRAIRIIDSSTGTDPNEPSAEEMAIVVARTYQQMSQNMNNPSNVWQAGPMRDLMTLFSGAVGPTDVRVAYFEKLGCLSSAASGQPGYNCEMVVELQTSNRQLAQALPRGTFNGRGRFLRRGEEWMFISNPPER